MLCEYCTKIHVVFLAICPKISIDKYVKFWYTISAQLLIIFFIPSLIGIAVDVIIVVGNFFCLGMCKK